MTFSITLIPRDGGEQWSTTLFADSRDDAIRLAAGIFGQFNVVEQVNLRNGGDINELVDVAFQNRQVKNKKTNAKRKTNEQAENGSRLPGRPVATVERRNRKCDGDIGLGARERSVNPLLVCGIDFSKYPAEISANRRLLGLWGGRSRYVGTCISRVFKEFLSRPGDCLGLQDVVDELDCDRLPKLDRKRVSSSLYKLTEEGLLSGKMGVWQLKMYEDD